MRFYDLLIIEKGRIDVSRYFQRGDEVVFFYDNKEDLFGIKLSMSGTLSNSPEWEKVGNLSPVGFDGKVEVPWWVLEVAGVVDAFLISPQYSTIVEKIVSAYLIPLDEVEKPKKKKQKEVEKQLVTEFKKPDFTDLSERMLKASFGEDFDTKAGSEASPLMQDYTDDL